MIRHTIHGAKGTVMLEFPDEHQPPVMHLTTFGGHPQFTEAEALELAQVVVKVFGEIGRKSIEVGRDA